jgi:hypothetical protein
MGERMDVNTYAVASTEVAILGDWIAGAVAVPEEDADYGRVLGEMSALINGDEQRRPMQKLVGRPRRSAEELWHAVNLDVVNSFAAADDVPSVQAFVEAHGPLRHEDYDRPAIAPRRVSAYCSGLRHAGYRPFAIPMSEFAEQRALIEQFTTWLKQASGRARGRHGRTGRNVKVGPGLPRQATDQDWSADLNRAMNEGLSGVVLRMHGVHNHPYPFLLATTVLPGIYARLWEYISNGTLLRQCPFCRRLFVPTRDWNAYCGTKCQTNHKQRRFRSRQRAMRRRGRPSGRSGGGR